MRIAKVRIVAVNKNAPDVTEKRVNELLADGLDMLEVRDGVVIMVEWEEVPMLDPEPATIMGGPLLVREPGDKSH